jgi:hypothetical protein
VMVCACVVMVCACVGFECVGFEWIDVCCVSGLYQTTVMKLWCGFVISYWIDSLC